MRINSERLEALLLEMLAGLRRGPYEDMSMCILERDGMQIQVHVTSDPREFIGVVTSGVVEGVSTEAPGFNDFMDQLKAAGVSIEGEASLRTKVAASSDWTNEVGLLAEQGRKIGIRFTRGAADAPSSEQIDAILRGYPFKGAARAQVINNIV